VTAACPDSELADNCDLFWGFLDVFEPDALECVLRELAAGTCDGGTLVARCLPGR